MSKYTIGIDLGGTTMTAGLVNENYEIVAKTTWATPMEISELHRDGNAIRIACGSTILLIICM